MGNWVSTPSWCHPFSHHKHHEPCPEKECLFPQDFAGKVYYLHVSQGPLELFGVLSLHADGLATLDISKQYNFPPTPPAKVPDLITSLKGTWKLHCRTLRLQLEGFSSSSNVSAAVCQKPQYLNATTLGTLLVCATFFVKDPCKLRGTTTVTRYPTDQFPCPTPIPPLVKLENAQVEAHVIPNLCCVKKADKEDQDHEDREQEEQDEPTH